MSPARPPLYRHLALIGFALASAAPSPLLAADYLRGAYDGAANPNASSGPDWAGFYAGVHAGITSAKSDATAHRSSLATASFTNATPTSIVSSMVDIRQNIKAGVSYGGFVGVNYLWDDVVLGFEADYTHSGINTQSNISRSRTLAAAGATEWDVNINTRARTKMSDWATLRGRAGYAMGYIMPYMTAGIAFGNLSSLSSVSGSAQQYDVSVPLVRTPIGGPLFLSGQIKHSGISYGGAIGAGIDVQIVPNTFLRAEWQYIQFASGGGRPDIAINTARVAGGMKF